MVYTIVSPEDEDIEEGKEAEVSEDELTGTALSTQDWHKAQADNQNICFITDRLIAGETSTTTDVERNNIDKSFLHHWENYKLKNGVLYGETTINCKKIEQLVLQSSLAETIFRAYQDDLGHQVRDRKTSMIRRRYFWPGMNTYIKTMVQLCERCIRRKKAPFRPTELMNITSFFSMELVSIDYLNI